MTLRACLLVAGLLGAALIGTSHAANLTEGMAKGTPELKSAGPATFAPQGILLVGDTQGATIFAIATDDTPAAPCQGALEHRTARREDRRLAGDFAGRDPDQRHGGQPRDRQHVPDRLAWAGPGRPSR